MVKRENCIDFEGSVKNMDMQADRVAVKLPKLTIRESRTIFRNEARKITIGAQFPDVMA